MTGTLRFLFGTAVPIAAICATGMFIMAAFLAPSYESILLTLMVCTGLAVGVIWSRKP